MVYCVVIRKQNIRCTNLNDIVTLVDINLTAHRKANDKRTIRKNVTLPNWLKVTAEKERNFLTYILVISLFSTETAKRNFMLA